MKKTAKEFLIEEFPTLNKQLEDKLLRGFVCTAMEKFAQEYGQALLQKASEEAMLEIDNEGYLEYQKEYMDHDANPITSPVYRVSKKHILNTKLDLI